MMNMHVQPLLVDSDVKPPEKNSNSLPCHHQLKNTNVSLQLIDSFNKVVENLVRTLPKNSLLSECILLEFIFNSAHKKISLVKTEFIPAKLPNFIILDIGIDEDVRELEELMLEIYQLTSSHAQVWNKSRLFFIPRDHNFYFEYKFDTDLLWAQGVDPNSIQYQRIRREDEDKIMYWSGLPSDYVRPWIN